MEPATAGGGGSSRGGGAVSVPQADGWSLGWLVPAVAIIGACWLLTEHVRWALTSLRKALLRHFVWLVKWAYGIKARTALPPADPDALRTRCRLPVAPLWLLVSRLE